MITDSFLYRFIRPLFPQWYADRWSREQAKRIKAQGVGNVAVSAIGINCIGGNRTGFGPFLDTINAAVRRLAVAVDYDDFGAALECKTLWPDIMTVGMLTSTDFGFDYAALVTKARQNPHIDYWCVYNEIGGQDAATYGRMADDYIALMPKMKADGLRLGMFSTASGTPPLPSEDGGACYDQIARACKFAKDNGYDAILCVHEYQSSGTIGRYKHLADWMESRGALLPIVVSEFGFETHPGDAMFMGMVQANDPVYMVDKRVIGCGTWILGGGGWAGSNYATALPQLGQYIATVKPIDPIDPPPSDEWIVDDVLIDGVSIGPQMSGEIVMTADHTLELKQHPKPITHNLTVVETPTGGWRIEPRSGPHNHGEIVEWQIVRV